MAIIRKVETPDLRLATITTGPEWEITFHRLFYVSPDDADKVVVVGAGVSVWDICFLEDLLHILNSSKNLLLDVGWTPHADPAGTYRLRLVRLNEEGNDSRSPYDWQHPVIDVRTRSIDQLLNEIEKLVSA